MAGHGSGAADGYNVVSRETLGTKLVTSLRLVLLMLFAVGAMAQSGSPATAPASPPAAAQEQKPADSNAATGEDQISGTIGGAVEETLAADQPGGSELGDP